MNTKTHTYKYIYIPIDIYLYIHIYSFRHPVAKSCPARGSRGSLHCRQHRGWWPLMWGWGVRGQYSLQFIFLWWFRNMMFPGWYRLQLPHISKPPQKYKRVSRMVLDDICQIFSTCVFSIHFGVAIFKRENEQTTCGPHAGRLP